MASWVNKIIEMHKRLNIRGNRLCGNRINNNAITVDYLEIRDDRVFVAISHVTGEHHIELTREEAGKLSDFLVSTWEKSTVNWFTKKGEV